MHSTIYRSALSTWVCILGLFEKAPSDYFGVNCREVTPRAKRARMHTNTNAYANGANDNAYGNCANNLNYSHAQLLATFFSARKRDPEAFGFGIHRV